MNKKKEDIDLFKNIFQSSVEGILVVDDDGIIIKANAASEKLFGYNRGALLNQSIESLIPDTFKKKHESHRETYNKKPKTRQIGQHLDLWGLKKDGTIFPLDISLSPTKINDRQVVIAFVFDITKQKNLNTLFSIRNNALDSASNSIIIADAQSPDTPIIYCNDAFRNKTGYSQEEILGRNCNFLQNDDRDQKEISIMKNAIIEGEACNVILRNYKKDGTLFWNEISITPVFNKEQTLTHFIGVQNEVTKKVNEESLKNQTRKILELIAQDESIKTISNKIVDTVDTHFKDCMASILVLDTVHKTLHKLAAPNVPKEFIANTEGIPIGPKTASFGTAAFFKKEIIVANIEENILWEDYKDIAIKSGLKACWSFPIMSSTKNILGIFAIYSRQARKPSQEEKEIAIDMSYLASIAIEKHNNVNTLKENKRELEKHAHKLEEKVIERTKEVMATVEKLVASNLSLEDQIQETQDAERKVLESKFLLDNISRNFPKGFVAVVDTHFKVVFIEGEELEELGFKGLANSKNIEEDVKQVPEYVKAKVKAHIQKTFKGEHCTFEIAFKNRHYLVNTTPLRNKNNIEQVLLVHNNITLQKEAEIEMMNSLKKEQELGELKSRFVSMASHEFRTPLSAIQTSAILIGKQNEAGNEQKREKYVAQIKKNVKQLIIILNDFLSLSKLEEGKVEASMELFDFVDLSKTLIKEVSMTKKTGKNIIFYSPDHPVLLKLDPKLVRHVFMNLVSNAIKYSPKNTDIKIKIKENNLFVSLKIQDKGIGIPEEEQHKLFERFFRAKNAQNIQGTGLGLNIVKQYVDLMGGTITFKSKTNKGTTFLVKWPKPIKPI